MPKKILYESFIYRILAESSEISRLFSEEDKWKWIKFVESLEFKNHGKMVSIITPCKIFEVPINGATFYKRGDIQVQDKSERHQNIALETDETKARNKAFFNDLVKNIALANKFEVEEFSSSFSLTNRANFKLKDSKRFDAEKKFHDQWAENENIENTR